MGGDEFGAGCWDAVPAVKAFRQAKNWTSARLLQYYMSKVFAIVAKHKKDPMLVRTLQTLLLVSRENLLTICL